jgi:hypothetical protein
MGGQNVSWITASTFGVLYKVCRVLERTMTGEDAARLIDDTLDLVHQRQTVDGD